MTSIARINARRKSAGLPLIRFAIRRLSPDDIQDLRDAFSAMYEITETAVGDRRGYWALARGHGYDQDLCHDDDRVFLTWHRAYVYSFEKALNTALQWKRGDKDLELTLPFWDWTVFDPATDAANGIPHVLDEPSYPRAGAATPNPLRSARSMYRVMSQHLTGPAEMTARHPGRFRAAIPQLADDIARNLSNPDFTRFSSDLDGGAHGTVHVTVGGADPSSPLPQHIGDMTSIVSAAYDPIFWFHHAMIDKVWFDWQTTNGNATVPRYVLDTVVYGGFVGAELIDAEHSLKYIYSNEAVSAAEEKLGTIVQVPAGQPPAPPAPTGAPGAPAPPAPPPPPSFPTFAVGELRSSFARAQLDFHQLRPPKASYEIRAFINNKQADDKTPIDDPTFGGRIVLFGHGACHGAKGHCDPEQAERDDYDLRDKHPLRWEHTKYAIDVTRGLRRALAAHRPLHVEITLVTLDAAGNAVAPSCVRYRGVSLSTR